MIKMMVTSKIEIRDHNFKTYQSKHSKEKINLKISNEEVLDYTRVDRNDSRNKMEKYVST